MIHARKDYQPIQDPRGLIPEDEPVFLLRGQDPAAPIAVETWARKAESLGADPKIVTMAMEHAEKMRRYQNAGHLKPFPDLPKEDADDNS